MQSLKAAAPAVIGGPSANGCGEGRRRGRGRRGRLSERGREESRWRGRDRTKRDADGGGGGKTDEQETGEEEDLRQDGSLFFLSVSSLSAERFRLHYTRHGDVWQHPRKPKVRAFCFK